MLSRKLGHLFGLAHEEKTFLHQSYSALAAIALQHSAVLVIGELDLHSYCAFIFQLLAVLPRVVGVKRNEGFRV